ncbi:MAG: ABC transporter substrate-binding protein [Novosphingobium sp.]|nr:ABC transporter substrate-binding protein [Novosphingobium sp.]
MAKGQAGLTRLGACGWLALAVIMVLSGCTAALPRNGDRPRPTIVSLNPCSDEVLAEVADPGQLLAISHYSHDPFASSMGVRRARRFQAISGSLEEILVLRPDVVVADIFLPEATRFALDQLGIRLVSLPIARSVEESRAQVLELARLAGHPDRGKALDARISAALASASAAPGQAPVKAVIWQGGGIVPGADTLIADLLARTGFVSHSAARGLRQGDILPLEEMLADPPAVILAAGDPRANEDRMLSHPALDALASTRRESFDRALLWCGGPTIIRAARRLAQIRQAL